METPSARSLEQRLARRPALADKFRRLLDSPSVNEHKCQRFMERHIELLYTPFLLNHWIHFGCVISRFPLTVELVTDFAYLTKSTDQWRLVLVELESPNARLFRKGDPYSAPSAELTRAISQTNSWREYLRDHAGEVLDRLGPLRVPLSQNPVDFFYLIVIGRSEEKSQAAALRRRMVTLAGANREIVTYDSLLSSLLLQPAYGLNVLRVKHGVYYFLHMNVTPEVIFSYVPPTHLRLSPDQREELIREGFDIASWEAGHLLSLNGRLPMTDGNIAKTAERVVRSVRRRTPKALRQS